MNPVGVFLFIICIALPAAGGVALTNFAGQEGGLYAGVSVGIVCLAALGAIVIAVANFAEYGNAWGD